VPDRVICGQCTREFTITDFSSYLEHKISRCAIVPSAGPEHDRDTLPSSTHNHHGTTKETGVGTELDVSSTTANPTAPTTGKRITCHSCKRKCVDVWALLEHVFTSHGLRIADENLPNFKYPPISGQLQHSGKQSGGQQLTPTVKTAGGMDGKPNGELAEALKKVGDILNQSLDKSQFLKFKTNISGHSLKQREEPPRRCEVPRRQLESQLLTQRLLLRAAEGDG